MVCTVLEALHGLGLPGSPNAGSVYHTQHRYQGWCPHIPSLPLPERGMAGTQSNTSNDAGEAAGSDQDDGPGERPTG